MGGVKRSDYEMGHHPFVIRGAVGMLRLRLSFAFGVAQPPLSMTLLERRPARKEPESRRPRPASQGKEKSLSPGLPRSSRCIVLALPEVSLTPAR